MIQRLVICIITLSIEFVYFLSYLITKMDLFCTGSLFGIVAINSNSIKECMHTMDEPLKYGVSRQ
jgi:hypothetical protein